MHSLNESPPLLGRRCDNVKNPRWLMVDIHVNKPEQNLGVHNYVTRRMFQTSFEKI